MTKKELMEMLKKYSDDAPVLMTSTLGDIEKEDGATEVTKVVVIAFNTNDEYIYLCEE